jgi:dipeptidyl aminopeptidase/acylaminoacyl peptidase
MGTGRRSGTARGAGLLATVGLTIAGAVGGAPLDPGRYERAAARLPGALSGAILNAQVVPHWRAGERERFTYRRELADGRAEFVAVDAASGGRTPAFDATIVAAGLSAVTGTTVAPDRLPFTDYEEVDGAILVGVGTKSYACRLDRPDCRERGVPVPDRLAVPSPDGRWLAYTEAGNLWLRSADGATRFALTEDGEPHRRYASDPDALRQVLSSGPFRTPAGLTSRSVAGPPVPDLPPAVVWSPDSRRLFAQRIDERSVREVSITQSAPTDGAVHPVTFTWRSARPDDPALPMAESFVFDVGTRRAVRVALDAVPTPFASAARLGEVAWSADGRRLALVTRTRYAKSMALHLVDAGTGAVATPVEETAETFVEPAALGDRPIARVLDNGDVVWFSERTGHGHLYLHDGRTGRLRRALTEGDWDVRELISVDERAGSLLIAAVGREPGDPYHRRVYRVSLAGGAPRLLTREDADHEVLNAQRPRVPFGYYLPQGQGVSPSGRYFVDTYSRVDLPETTVLRRADGSIVATVEVADTRGLAARGITRLPERFRALAADGRTPLYGVIWRPSDYDPNRRYPLLDSIYPGPQQRRAPVRFSAAVLDSMGALAYAELGMVVVALDGRGTPGRSKAFLDESYGRLDDPGCLDDHVAVLTELARRDPAIDVARVGIAGTSGGGYATAHAMFTKADFYKVGVSDAGNHDQRLYIAVWGETYNGPPRPGLYDRASNAALAAGLTGHLLLLHGDMDANVLPAHTLQVVDALERANKTFELVLVPNVGHTTILAPGYGLRRAWDFLVRHLVGAEPPADWAFATAD